MPSAIRTFFFSGQCASTTPTLLRLASASNVAETFDADVKLRVKRKDAAG